MATEVNTKRDRKFQQKITTREIREKGSLSEEGGGGGGGERGNRRKI